jgi:hypothetical protein
VAGQQHLAEAALPDHLEELKVAGAYAARRITDIQRG